MASTDTPPNNLVSGVDVDERGFTWTIENFAAVAKMTTNHSTLITAQAIDFAAGDKVGLPSNWTVFLKEYPETNSIGIFVRLKDTGSHTIDLVPGCFSWEIKNNRGVNYLAGAGSIQGFMKDVGFGYPDMLSRDERRNAPLVDGNLVIHINFKVYAPKRTIGHPKPVEALLEEFHLKSTEQTLRDLEGSLEDLADCTIKRIKSNDGKTFPVLTRILAARSPIFEAMLRAEMIEAEQDTIEVPDISSRPLEILLMFMCTGELQPDWNQKEVIVELTYAAAKYQLLDLLEFLDSILAKVCDLENAGVLLMLANQLSLKKAEEELLAFMKREALNSSENMLQLLKGVSGPGDAMEVEDEQEGDETNGPVPACLRKIQRGLSTIQRRKKK